MKYVVLSFDDGFLDFKKNALPILDKFGFKATLAIVSGYLDGTSEPSHQCLSINDVNDLIKSGHEISLHSDTHPKNISVLDFKKCQIKINSWFGVTKYGAIIPYSQKIDNSVLDFLLSNCLYFADHKSHITKKNI